MLGRFFIVCYSGRLYISLSSAQSHNFGIFTQTSKTIAAFLSIQEELLKAIRFRLRIS